MRQFYYAEEGESHGPVSPAEFRARGLAPTTLIWLEELNDWKPAAEVPELAAALYGAAPPLPRKEKKRDPEPRHVPHPEAAPVQSWQSTPLPPGAPTAAPRPQTKAEYQQQRREERKRDPRQALPPIIRPQAGRGGFPWRLLFLIGLGVYLWAKNRDWADAPPEPAPTETTAPAASPDAPPPLTDGHSARWRREAEDPLKYVTVEYNQPASLTGTTTISGTVRSAAREVTLHHLMVQVSFLNATGELLVKEWAALESDLAPGASAGFDLPVTAPRGAESVQVEVLKAEGK